MVGVVVVIVVVTYRRHCMVVVVVRVMVMMLFPRMRSGLLCLNLFYQLLRVKQYYL